MRKYHCKFSCKYSSPLSFGTIYRKNTKQKIFPFLGIKEEGGCYKELVDFLSLFRFDYKNLLKTVVPVPVFFSPPILHSLGTVFLLLASQGVNRRSVAGIPGPVNNGF
jgi:hypothetical protein